MKRDIEKTLGLLKKIVLTEHERNAVRLRIREAFKATPVTFSEISRHPIGKISITTSSLYALFVNIKNNRMAPLALGLIMALSLGGSVAAAAEQSLPGDTLYPVKISVNEEIQSAFAFSDEARAEFETKRAERRLEEASRLSKEGRLNAETRVELETQLATHIQNAESRVAKLKARGRAENSSHIETKLETSLSAYADILSEVDGDVLVATSSKLETRSFIKTIKEKAVRVKDRRNEMDNDVHNSYRSKVEIRSSSEQNAHEDSARVDTENNIRVRIEDRGTDSGGGSETEDSVKVDGTVRSGIRLPF